MRSAAKSKDDIPITKFKLDGLYQSAFWENHKSCFLFDQKTFKVNINKYHLASSKYIIRKLETKIVNEMVETLVHLGSTKQRQLVCLVSVDKNKKILKEQPKDWD